MVTKADIDIFLDKDEQINALIDSTAKIISKEKFIIRDGVSFPEIYLNTTPKIMWILKEAYELHGDYSSWKVGRIYKQDQKTKRILKIRQIKRIARINYCIMHNIEEYKDTIKIEDDELVDAIQSMAIININKIAAGTSSGDLSPQYEIWKDVLNLQLSLYNPDIIICGNTLQYFKKSDDIKYISGIKNKLGMNNHYYFYFKNKIFINAFHPSYFKIDDNLYINKILNAINVWENYKKTVNKSQMSQDCLRFTPFEGPASAKPQSG